MPRNTDDMKPLIEAIGLSKYYKVKRSLFSSALLRAVDDVSFEVFEGETLGVIGESGSGKSTLGRVLGQLLAPTSGTMIFRGKDVSRVSLAERRALRRQVQIIFQDPYSSLNPRMTVRDILMEPLRNFGIARGAEAERMVSETLELCGIGRSALNRYPREFSGGQRQRIGIARAIILRPTFIVADEPVSALDVSIQAQIINFLRALQSKFKITYLFIGHDMAVVRHISTRVAVMYLGKLVEIADSRTIYSNARHPYTRVLLSSVPIPDPAAERRRCSISLAGEIPSPLSPPPGCTFHTRCPWVRHPRCSTEAPAIREIAPGHLAACHYAEELADLPSDGAPAAMQTQLEGAAHSRAKA